MQSRTLDSPRWIPIAKIPWTTLYHLKKNKEQILITFSAQFKFLLWPFFAFFFSKWLSGKYSDRSMKTHTFIVKEAVERPAPFLDLIWCWSPEHRRTVTLASDCSVCVSSSKKLEFLFHILCSEKTKNIENNKNWKADFLVLKLLNHIHTQRFSHLPLV